MAELTPAQWAAALANRDLVGKALLLVSRAKHATPSGDLSFSKPREFPNIEPLAVADDIWTGFAAQKNGENILEGWRREGRALINTITAFYLAGPHPAEVVVLIEEKTALEAEWSLRDKSSDPKVKRRIARLNAIDAGLRALGISPT